MTLSRLGDRLLARFCYPHRANVRVLCLSFALSGISFAATPQTPSAEFEARQKLVPSQRSTEPPADHHHLAAPITGYAKQIIHGFRFVGAHRIPVERLTAELASFAGQELSAEDLQNAALAIANLYLRQGGMAKVSVSAVSRAEGIVEFDIQELRVGQIRIDLPTGSRIARELVTRFVTSGVSPNDPFPLARLEDGVSHFNNQPGVSAAIALDSGAQPDEVDITVQVRDRPILSGRAYLDNYGMREIGQERLGVSLRASNTLGTLERIAIDVEKTSGSTLLSPSLSIALPDPDMRAAVEATQATYQALRTGAASQLRGRFQLGRAMLTHRLIQEPGLALIFEYSLSRTSYHDGANTGELRRRRISAVSGNLAGMIDSRIGTTIFGVELDRGKADLSANATDYATDAIAARMDGTYWRLRWRLGHELAFGSGTLLLQANGQWANRNLDPTQQFALGGVSQVRAYPTLEALGDGGWGATAQWRQTLADGLDGRVFADTGGIQRNAKPWTNQDNRYGISGIGAGLTWHLPDSFRFDADLAQQYASNPNRNADGTDFDGRNQRWRLWLALSREL